MSHIHAYICMQLHMWNKCMQLRVWENGDNQSLQKKKKPEPKLYRNLLHAIQRITAQEGVCVWERESVSVREWVWVCMCVCVSEWVNVCAQIYSYSHILDTHDSSICTRRRYPYSRVSFSLCVHVKDTYILDTHILKMLIFCTNIPTFQILMTYPYTTPKKILIF